ncbi:ThuA domain-containing protein [Gordonia amarae]|uniref:ThuA-like domain-containing protein n=2 Tax=Gordonia amarae TaxID=36821 RepID=G7GKS7_9ACTN|nr:ThuA domain-containing protein [Gordonia amarae]MCS3879355.1 type 1 glutamine amidotransferase [Gordonia amarae]QHN17835.1 ThuA domain-containing protein [Gordonia amarae]QHN22366.1 ThuA domain-containing protein [Gordonia amarae]QHN31242.1 ThuA domain-containing protein [Gordonia amarae]QHN39987.1 ThuA domain-containing protein [Gordonia amarae]
MSQNPELPTAVIASGGIVHDFPASSAELATVLAECGFTDITVTDDVDALFSGLPGRSGRPLVVMNMLRFRMELDRYAHLRDEWALTLSANARTGLTDHVRGGGGLLAMHGAAICFDDWPEWRDLLGGRWEWDRSCHPPYGPMAVTVRTDTSPVVAGIGDFDIDDEAYGFLDLATDVTGLAFSAHGGAEHPLLWTRRVGRGRVAYDALGHDVASLRLPQHRTIVSRAALWAAGADSSLPS